MTTTDLARISLAVVASALVIATISTTAAADSRGQIVDGYARIARAEKPDFKGFSADRGKAFFEANPATGKPDTPSCTTCHTKDPLADGLTRAGKAIEPMAVSKTPGRYIDAAKVEKWFRRNCKSVLGRACSALEKGDFIAFMSSR